MSLPPEELRRVRPNRGFFGDETAAVAPAIDPATSASQHRYSYHGVPGPIQPATADPAIGLINRCLNYTIRKNWVELEPVAPHCGLVTSHQDRSP